MGISSLMKILKRWKFWLFYGINQIGSLLYGRLLGVYPEQFSSISANALTVVVTFVTESILKKRPLKIKQVTGVLMIIGGIYFILWSWKSIMNFRFITYMRSLWHLWPFICIRWFFWFLIDSLSLNYSYLIINLFTIFVNIWIL